MLSLLQLGLCTLLINNAYGRIKSFSESTVLGFIHDASKMNISRQCMESLRRINPFLSRYDTVADQKNFLISSYSIGPTNAVDGRDQFRWIYRMGQCQAVAGEKVYSHSENPTQFCTGKGNGDAHSNTYGICLPQPCHDDRYALLDEWMNVVSNSNDTIERESVDCRRSRRDSEWYNWWPARLDTIITFMFIILVAMATAYDIARGSSMGECGKLSTTTQIFLAYSLKKNCTKLIALPRDNNSTITCLFGIRFFSMIWVIAGHSFVMAQAVLENVTVYEEHGSKFENQWMSNGTICVDTFFLIGAVLTAFIFFRNFGFKGKGVTWRSYNFWAMFVVHRALRLWPAYLMAMSNLSFRWSHTPTQELWRTHDPYTECPKDGWKNLLFINSLTVSWCMPWTWYVSADFIFNLVAPIYLLALKRSATFGYSLCIATILASGFLNVWTNVRNRFAPVLLLFREPPPEFNDDFVAQLMSTYVGPQYRIGSYMVGLMLGYYLAKLSLGLSSYRPSRMVFTIGTISAGLIGFSALYGMYPLMQGWHWPIYYVLYGASYRTVWSLCVAWLIYFCFSWRDSILNRFLSSRIFIPLSNLCYSAYLMHGFGIIAGYMALPFPLQYTGYGMLWECLIQITITFSMATFTLFIAEYPCVNLLRMLCKRVKR